MSWKLWIYAPCKRGQKASVTGCEPKGKPKGKGKGEAKPKGEPKGKPKGEAKPREPEASDDFDFRDMSPGPDPAPDPRGPGRLGVVREPSGEPVSARGPASPPAPAAATKAPPPGPASPPSPAAATKAPPPAPAARSRPQRNQPLGQELRGLAGEMLGGLRRAGSGAMSWADRLLGSAGGVGGGRKKGAHSLTGGGHAASGSATAGEDTDRREKAHWDREWRAGRRPRYSAQAVREWLTHDARGG